MSKRLILLIIAAALQMLPQAVFSQDTDTDEFVDPNQPQIDSLLNVTKPDSPDSVKARNYYSVAWITCDNDTCLKYALLSLEFCKPTDSVLIARNYNNLSYSYYMKDETRKALQYRLKAADIYNKVSYKQDEAISFMSIGKFYEDLNIRDSIFYYYNKALKYFAETQDTGRLIKLYFGLSSAYFNSSLYANAEENLRKALNYAELSNDTLKIAYSYSRIGEIYLLQSDTLLNRTIKILNKSVQMYESVNVVKYNEVNDKYFAYALLASAYINMAETTGEKAYADSCYMYIKKIGNYYLATGAYYDYIESRYSYVDYLVFYKRYNDALAELLKLGKYLTDNSSIFTLVDYNNKLYQVYSHLGDYKNALRCHEKYMEYKIAYVNDSSLNSIKNAEVERTRMLDSVNHKFETMRIETEHQKELTKTRMKTRVLLSIALIFILVGVILFFFYKTAKESEENKLRADALEIERTLLRTQMNPHFIFNALNSIQSFITSNNQGEAVRYLSKFAKLMRMILNNSMQQYVLLSEELASLSLYLDLEQVRFNNRFSYKIDIDDEVEEDLVKVPPMLIQPFVENAILHGLMHKPEGGLITICLAENGNNTLTCTITDNGVGRKAAAEIESKNEHSHKSVGMQLTRDRLQELNSNTQHSCAITDLEDSDGNALGTQVIIIIPEQV
ncbi:MAG: histidine kinase [Salinivirgaceae bacterium]|nr:histidine kinase [Salinivirgaceae bacterium]MBO7594978.1 histidine kinase [Salinivirgaceae bacterium]